MAATGSFSLCISLSISLSLSFCLIQVKFWSWWGWERGGEGTTLPPFLPPSQPWWLTTETLLLINLQPGSWLRLVLFILLLFQLSVLFIDTFLGKYYSIWDFLKLYITAFKYSATLQLYPKYKVLTATVYSQIQGSLLESIRYPGYFKSVWSPLQFYPI